MSDALCNKRVQYRNTFYEKSPVSPGFHFAAPFNFAGATIRTSGCAPYTRAKLGLKSEQLPLNYFQIHFDSCFSFPDAYRTASPTFA